MEQACAFFAQSGLPIRPDRLRLLIRGLDWAPAARGPSPPQGGVGPALYWSADLMVLHARLAEFLESRGIPRRPPRGGGDTPAGTRN